jgi:hypothetical protein
MSRSKQGDFYLSIMGEVGRDYYMGVEPLLISFWDYTMRLFLGCTLIGIPVLEATVRFGKLKMQLWVSMC